MMSVWTKRRCGSECKLRLFPILQVYKDPSFLPVSSKTSSKQSYQSNSKAQYNTLKSFYSKPLHTKTTKPNYHHEDRRRCCCLCRPRLLCLWPILRSHCRSLCFTNPSSANPRQWPELVDRKEDRSLLPSQREGARWLPEGSGNQLRRWT